MDLVIGIFKLIYYFPMKWLAYAGWSYVGLRWLMDEKNPAFGRAASLGLVRVVIGLCAGIPMSLLFFSIAARFDSQAIAYLAIFLPIRWLEWGILESFLCNTPIWNDSLLSGKTSASRSWRFGGIIISCLIDVLFHGFKELNIGFIC